jgi:hypothetical protein
MASEEKAPETVAELKPKRQRREKAAIIPLPPPAEIRLGSLSIHDPKEMIARAAELAKALAEIIHSVKDSDGKPTLYVIIQNRKYVKVEGWTTLGAMMGVVPVEEYCDPLPDNSGYKAKVKLIRMVDQAQVGGASAICKMKETGWNKEEAPTHSKAITRATGKAFRLSFAWVMKLAGFEPTPAEELFEVGGSSEEAQDVAKSKIEEALGKKFETLAEAEAAYPAKKDQDKAEKKTAKETCFITWPPAHNGHKALFIGQTAVRKCGGEALMMKSARWNDRDMGWYVDREAVPELAATLTALGCQVVDKDNPDLTQLLQKSLETMTNGNAQRGKGATPVS